MRGGTEVSTWHHGYTATCTVGINKISQLRAGPHRANYMTQVKSDISHTCAFPLADRQIRSASFGLFLPVNNSKFIHISPSGDSHAGVALMMLELHHSRIPSP